MKDIDFDELDKAVNSLMATTSQPAAASETPPTQSVITIPTSSTAPVSDTSVDSPTPSPLVPASSVIPVAVRPRPPAVKRSGRFMDMVSTPSEPKVRVPVTSQATSREGLAVMPRSAEVVAEPDTPTITPSGASPSQNSTLSFTSMPDPIDEQERLQAPDEPSTLDSTSVEAAQPVDVSRGALESPFLSDAKVEKRPLNAGSQESEFFEATYVADAPVQNDFQPPDLPTNDEPPATPQVAELDETLLAIEANEKIELTQAVETTDVASEVQAPAIPLGATSIAQQYTSQPSSGDQSHAAIYDASQYPEPISHPAKSKSGWLWVLWVILLLGVGAGGAVMLYNLGIIP